MPSVRNSIALLRRLAGSPRPVRASALARSLEMPRSSTYQLLQVLIDEGLVVHVPETRGYTLGVGVFELGTAYLRRQPLEHLAQPLLIALAQRIGHTVQLGILQGNETLYLLKEQPATPTPLVTGAGIRLPAHVTASGRAMLFGLPAAQVRALFAGSAVFPTMTGEGPTTLRDLRRILAAEKALGWSIERGAVTPGITSIAAPVTDQTGRPVASVVVSFASDHRALSDEELSREVVRTAEQVSRRLLGR